MTKFFAVIVSASAVLLVAACGYTKPPSGVSSEAHTAGRKLFLKNCAHCHAADARGDEGPDLHKLDWSPDQIAKRIRNGKKGQMTAFAEKLKPDEINLLVAYVRSLN